MKYEKLRKCRGLSNNTASNSFFAQKLFFIFWHLFSSVLYLPIRCAVLPLILFSTLWSADSNNNISICNIFFFSFKILFRLAGLTFEYLTGRGCLIQLPIYMVIQIQTKIYWFIKIEYLFSYESKWLKQQKYLCHHICLLYYDNLSYSYILHRFSPWYRK